MNRIPLLLPDWRLDVGANIAENLNKQLLFYGSKTMYLAILQRATACDNIAAVEA